MNQQYYFIFTSGPNEDFTCGNPYVCDHFVSSEEWDKFSNEFVKVDAAKRKSVLKRAISHGYMVPDESTAEYEDWIKWRTENNPERRFVELHGMKEMDFVSLDKSFY